MLLILDLDETLLNVADSSCLGAMTGASHQRTIAEVRGTLTTGFAEVDAWFDRPEETRAFRPSDGGWTVDEVLEHVTLTNHYLLLVIRKSTGKALARAARGEPVGDGESDLRLLDSIGERGSFAWPRPDHMVPTGQTTSDALVADGIRRSGREQPGLAASGPQAGLR